MEKQFEVQQFVRVTVDETKFTKEFLREFREEFYPLHSVEDHMRRLASLYAAGHCDECSEFIEGYGDPADFGIKFENTGFNVESI